MNARRSRAALGAARGGFALGLCVWCCSLYEGRTLEFFSDPGALDAECRSASECPRERAFCAAGACRECLVDDDCGRGKPACVGNVCVECRSASDCPSGQGCNPVLLTCSFSCGDPSDCAGQALSRCSSELDLCVQCLGDEDCSEPRDPACDTGGRCVECTAAEHCGPDRPSCDTPNRRCVECLDSTDCDGRSCDPRDQRCVECVSDADCGAGSCDERRRCRQACAGPEGCDDPRRPLCDVATGSCVECNTREQCPEPQRPACTPEHECVECLTDDDCSADEPACLATRRCGQCSRDSHCQAEQRCDLRSARCVPRPPGELDGPAAGGAPGQVPPDDAGPPPLPQP
jgi:Cys-rich repeat protein